MKSFPKKKAANPDDFNPKFYPTFKKKNKPFITCFMRAELP